MKSLGEAVSLASDTGKRQEASNEGERGNYNHKFALVAALVQKVEEFRSTLEQMDQHVGVLYLRETMKQGSKVGLYFRWWVGGNNI